MGQTDKEILGGFEKLSIIGSGGEGVVWKAKCVRDVHKIVSKDTIVALKITYERGVDANSRWQKLEARVKELMRLDNPHVVRYLGCFRERSTEGEKHVVVQEFLDGWTLKEQLAPSRLGMDVDEGVRVIGMVLEGLDYMSRLGICHRDIKPANIFLCADGGVKLIDFGVAKQTAVDVTVTVSDNIRGTWNYMAPDFTVPSFRGDVRSDVFSVGVLLHEMLVGTLPYADLKNLGMSGYYSRWSQQDSSDVPAIRIDPMAERLLIGAESVLSVALARDPAARYATFRDFRMAFDRCEFVYTKGGGCTYQRLKYVGRGGFGEVFKARCLETGDVVAVKKLLNPEYASRFRREAKVMRRLDDSCFVKFLDFFELRDGAYLVMRFLDGMPGSSLRDAIGRMREKDRGGMPKGLVLAAFERYARGLAVMHGRGIFHRDIKPGNLYYPEERPDCVAIMDFGIVRARDTTFTYGNTPCTPDYAPPEIVLTEDRGGPGMDIFALGLCMYEALTGGRKSYPTLASGTTGYNALFERAKTMQEPDFNDPRVQSDPELLALLRRMTAPDVSKRMTDANEVALEIRKLFYRPTTDAECPTTDVFGNSPDPTRPIDDKKLLEWFGKWRKTHPDPDPTPVFDPLTWHPAREKQPWKGIAAAMLVVVVLGAVAWGVWKSRYDEDRSLKPVPLPAPDRLVVTNHVHTVVTNAPPAPSVPEDYIKLKQKTFEIDFVRALTDEPVTNRRVRIAVAEEMLRKAIDTEQLYSEKEAEPLRQKIVDASRRVVGILVNGCDSELFVDDNSIPGGVERTFSFNDGAPEKHAMRLFGYEARPLPSDLDGKIIVVTTNDFKLSAVKMALPPVEKNIRCFFGGKPVGEAGLSLMPGTYECIYRKHGHDDQKVKFTVNLGTDGVIPKPSEWMATPVDVLLSPLEKDITCLIDGRQSSQVKKLVPGAHRVEYRRAGYASQTIPFKAELATPAAVPPPGKWSVRPVQVSLPSLERGVWCAIDGTDVVSAVELMPGDHTLEYGRDGYVRQSSRFVVQIGKPMTVAGPSRWEAVKPPPQQPAPDKSRPQSNVRSPSYKEALERYEFEDYGGALEKFHDALKENWRPSEGDLGKVEDAFKKRLEELNGLINRAKADLSIGRDPKRSLENLDEDRKVIIQWYNEIKAAR